MRINVTHVFVDDQDKALRFYTEVLGFEKKKGVCPTDLGPVVTAILDDTCGNLVQLAQEKDG